ncbi:MAG TPA: hypothetical protein VLD57_04130, partial [Blastocatellia bacterium]|nr:hypothetical protein [Blastocatellia bacterium]
PRHRLIDKAQADLRWANRAGSVSISLKIKNGHYKYGLNRLINLVHELFVHLNYSYANYMAENFDLPQE